MRITLGDLVELLPDHTFIVANAYFSSLGSVSIPIGYATDIRKIPDHEAILCNSKSDIFKNTVIDGLFAESKDCITVVYRRVDWKEA